MLYILQGFTLPILSGIYIGIPSTDNVIQPYQMMTLSLLIMIGWVGGMIFIMHNWITNYNITHFGHKSKDDFRCSKNEEQYS